MLWNSSNCVPPETQIYLIMGNARAVILLFVVLLSIRDTVPHELMEGSATTKTTNQNPRAWLALRKSSKQKASGPTFQPDKDSVDFFSPEDKADSERLPASRVSKSEAGKKVEDSHKKVGPNRSNHACVCDSTVCNCQNLHLKSIPKDLPRTIKALLLSRNDITSLPSCAFCSYTLLQNLDLAQNMLRELEMDSFSELQYLKSLQLELDLTMPYTSIPRHVLRPLQSLTTLKLSYISMFLTANGLPRFSPSYIALTDLKNLTSLYLNGIYGAEFGPEFQNMTSLRELSLGVVFSPSFQLNLQNTTFENLGQLTHLNISGCRISGDVLESGTFEPLQNLRVLDISLNTNLGMTNFARAMWGLRNSNLRTLKMNSIVREYTATHIDAATVRFLPETLKKLYVQKNNIVSIDHDVFDKLSESLEFIDIRYNLILMDPRTIPLSNFGYLETLLIGSYGCQDDDQNADIQVLSSLTSLTTMDTSHGVNEEDTNGKLGKISDWNGKLPWNLTTVKAISRPLDIHFLRSLDLDNHLESLDLSCSSIPSLELTDLPFPNLRYFDLGKASISRLVYYSGTTVHLRSLETLILAGNFLGAFLEHCENGGPFQALGNLTHLDLSLNQIKALPTDIFAHLHKMEYLRLDGNTLAHFDPDLSDMTRLKLLNLSNTEVSHLSSELRAHIDRLCENTPGGVKVDMRNCPIQCDCYNVDFLKWMVNSKAFDERFTGYLCKYPDSSTKYILDGYVETIQILERECAENFPLFVIILISTLIALFTVFGAVVYRCRWTLRYWYYAAYLKLRDRNERKDAKEFPYDVFVSYDSEDHRFIKRNLLPELESRGLKLLIHGRDFIAGTFIASNIVKAVGESRKTLVVLTHNLVNSDWCNYEIQMANMESVYTGRQVLLFLMKDSFTVTQLGKELLRHIRMNTYIPYLQADGEIEENVLQAFWDKLAHDLRY